MRRYFVFLILISIISAQEYGAPGTLKWKFKTWDDISSSPAIGNDGTIYFGSIDCFLYALNPDGKLKWKFKTDGKVFSSPAIGNDGTIYFGSHDNFLYALNPDGTLKWKFETGSGVFSSPAIGNDGTIYFGSDDYFLYALNPDGNLKWKFKTGSSIYSSPAIGNDGTIYFGSDDHFLYALNPDGKLKWKFKTGWRIWSSPAIGNDGTIYFGSNDNFLYAVRSESKGLANSSWPKFRQNAQNTGRLEFGIVKIAKREEGYETARKPKYPPDLLISDIKFSEPSKNDALDGYEKGIISFKIENKGKGEAINVSAKIIPLTIISGLQYNKIINIGNILPNSSKEVKLEIEAQPDVPEATARFRIEVVEEYGFDAEPFIIAFNVKPFKPPKFIIADYGIDDDKEGDSYGDNDGIIELGEAIEISLLIQNIGEGDAKEVKAQISIIGEGENIYYGGEKRVFNLGEIISGSYKNLKFFFSTNRRYGKDSIPIKINISESYGRYGKEIILKLPVNRPTGKGKEVVITEKPTKEEQKEKPEKPKQVKIDVDIIPKNSITKLENGICVIFGIEKYKYAPEATFANRDAVIFYEYAKQVFGIPEKNIYIRTNEDATKGEFDKVFGKDGWLKRRVREESDVIIYFSGHGSPDIKTQKGYLIPYDIDPNYASSGVAISEILNLLDEIKAKSVIFFIDACFSGRGREGNMILAKAKPIISPKIEKISQKVSILSSSSGGEISSSYPEMQHGLFTYYLLKGLGGEGDLNRDKKITLKELADYVIEKVSSKARELDREQTPEFQGIDKKLIRLK
ncbi:MAG: PQQ-binding-like beta-propeller repeat protein [candidate division WOR-3 bacterium]